MEFKETVQIANVELDNKIVGCGKDLERCRADFAANLEKSFTELDDVKFLSNIFTDCHKYFPPCYKYFSVQVVQNLATGEIADSVREIASFRTKIKDIGSKVSCDWWRAGHVTSILVCDWSRCSRWTPRWRR